MFDKNIQCLVDYIEEYGFKHHNAFKMCIYRKLTKFIGQFLCIIVPGLYSCPGSLCLY